MPPPDCMIGPIKAPKQIKNEDDKSKQTEYFVIFVKTPGLPGWKHNQKQIIMEVNIKAIHFDITDKLLAFTNKKIDKLARRFEAMTDVEVNYRLVKPETAMNKEAGVEIHVPGSAPLFASKTADTFEEALDLSLDALERQLERIKGV